MKLLLDENLPKRLAQSFIGYKVFTTTEMGWNGLKNGILLSKMLENDFNALITFDKNLQHQQNFKKYPIMVFVLSARNNTFSELSPLIPMVLEILKIQDLTPGPIPISRL